MKKSNFFWIGYSDLMTSLFFIILVIFAITAMRMKVEQKNLLNVNSKLSEVIAKNTENEKRLKEKEKENSVIKEENKRQEDLIKIQAEKFQIIQSVEKNLEALQNDNDLFVYEPSYKRYRLAFDVQYKTSKKKIAYGHIKNYYETVEKLDEVGNKLKSVVEQLKEQQECDSRYKNISYLIVVSGSASNLPGNRVDPNYLLSYERAYNLYKYWKKNLNIDFDDSKYHDFLEFQIAGNGFGGIGRFPRYIYDGFKSERKNQRFLINIIPKIGEI
jgi:hypothetical protein